ncbi:hypothetical protein DL96DRAFT_1606949 [Flagelloscypha sp. PMI_526]|nr:hypothetical protein DL96DRAFT_1606949 [Flagelloscypha sp. PMI_526]
MPLQELPADIQPAVFWESEDLETLFRCASVSQVWRVQALPVLLRCFSNLCLMRDSNDKQSDPKKLLTLFTDIWPDHVHHIRHLFIFLSSTPSVFDSQATQFLRLLPDVRSLGFYGSSKLGLAHELAKFEGILETNMFPRLTSLEISSFGIISLHSLLTMCPNLEKLELSGGTTAETFSEVDIQATPKLHPLHRLILWEIYEASRWDGIIRFFTRFIEVSDVVITSFRMGYLGSQSHDGTPFIKTLPWLRCLAGNLQDLDLWETLFYHLVGSYVKRENINEDQRNVFQLKSFPRLQSFRSTISLPKPKPQQNTRIEIAGFFMDWLAQQVSSLSPSHPLKRIGLDLTNNSECPWGHLLAWDGKSPPMPTTWPEMDTVFAQREPPIYAEYSFDYCMRGNEEMMDFVRGALPTLHERQILELVISYED